MKDISIHDIRIVGEFAKVPDEQLQWLIDNGETFYLEDGEHLFEIGDPVNQTYIILDGKLRVCVMQSGQLRELRLLQTGDVSGFLPFSRAKVTPGFCQTLRKSWMFKCSADKIKEGIKQHYELTEAMVHMMISRVREITSMQQQNEKMFALGKLSAGLAHELNNPAAAISRAAALLQNQVQQLPHLFKTVSSLDMKDEKIDKIENLIITKTQEQKPLKGMLEKAEREDEINDWMYDNNITDIDTEGLTELDFTVQNLETIKTCSAPKELNVVLQWISNFLVTNKMADDIRISSERISELVGAVKNFTFMDKATDRQLIDIHSGIRNTLTMLNFKLKKANINVIENYDDSMPKVKALPGELNQVWTNIIDNAIDAMETNKKGTIEIQTMHDNHFVKVHIKDDGPGIPKDVQQKIFDPFFTTKEMGKGTGLGLDVVSRIVHQHNGSVKVNSQPGETEFEVCFPMND